MKKISTVLLVWILAFINVNAQKKENIKIYGTIKGLPDGTKLYLIKNDIGIFPDTISSTYAKKSMFNILADLYSQGATYFLKIDTAGLDFPSDKNSWLMIVTDEKNIKIAANLTTWPEAKVENDAATAKYHTIAKYLNTKLDSVNGEFAKFYNDSIKREQITTETQQMIVNYLSSESDAYATALIAKNLRNFLGYQPLKDIYSKLSEKVKVSLAGKDLSDEIASREISNKIIMGAKILNFNVSLQNGQKTTILEVAGKNKLTLLDFWASWCTPCRDAFPKMKEIYNKYKEKGFNIIGVSTDKYPHMWLNALKTDNLPWPQVLDNIDLASFKIFGMEFIPSYILIDENGYLVAYHSSGGKVKEFGPKIYGMFLENAIDELLK